MRYIFEEVIDFMPIKYGEPEIKFEILLHTANRTLASCNINGIK